LCIPPGRFLNEIQMCGDASFRQVVFDVIAEIQTEAIASRDVKDQVVGRSHAVTAAAHSPPPRFSGTVFDRLLCFKLRSFA
jgi:hypothetical protein